jgi:hypothetical protein
MEQALRELGFERLVIARPSLLTGERTHWASRRALPKRWRWR